MVVDDLAARGLLVLEALLVAVDGLVRVDRPREVDVARVQHLVGVTGAGVPAHVLAQRHREHGAQLDALHVVLRDRDGLGQRVALRHRRHGVTVGALFDLAVDGLRGDVRRLALTRLRVLHAHVGRAGVVRRVGRVEDDHVLGHQRLDQARTEVVLLPVLDLQRLVHLVEHPARVSRVLGHVVHVLRQRGHVHDHAPAVERLRGRQPLLDLLRTVGVERVVGRRSGTCLTLRNRGLVVVLPHRGWGQEEPRHQEGTQETVQFGNGAEGLGEHDRRILQECGGVRRP